MRLEQQLESYQKLHTEALNEIREALSELREEILALAALAEKAKVSDNSSEASTLEVSNDELLR